MANLTAPCIVWFRQDLRLADNLALSAAAGSGRPLICVFILDDETPGAWAPGAASRWWLERSLRALSAALARLGARLVLRRGRAPTQIAELARATGAAEIYWNRGYEPFAIARDTAIKTQLIADKIAVKSFAGALLHEPWTLQSGEGKPYKVFTPFWRAARAARAAAPRAPSPAPKSLAGFAGALASDDLKAWRLSPSRPNWAKGFEQIWTPGETGAETALQRFLDTDLGAYADTRDRPDLDRTSRLSPHLHFGEISPAQIWRAVFAHAGERGLSDSATEKFLSELGWREFSQHLLYHWPELPQRNWKPAFDAFEWRPDKDGFDAWTRGRTGYPIVDAGMRQLWATGWMHNRVRMIVASFLVKDLLIDWRRGAAWFWDTLVDADLANNAASWQWVAGSGADAAPYFRIFNPTTQGQRYDPSGAYIRKWISELSDLPDDSIHAPWAAPPQVLAAAGVVLGQTYPRPIIDHAFARTRALEAYAAAKRD